MSKEASALIAEKVQQAYALVTECEQIADDHGIVFRFDIGRSLKYHPKGAPDPQTWSTSDEILDEGVWMSSSDYC